MLRKLVIGGASVLFITTGVAGPAFGGEVTGNGKPTQGPTHANSICVFSGQNDDPTAPLDGSGPNGPGGRVQNYGTTKNLGLLPPGIKVTPGIIKTPDGNAPGPCRGGGNPDNPPG